jgi:hypothetical protein
MERALFDAVQQKLTDQWTTRSRVRNPGDHLLTGLLFDDAGYPMAPTHATYPLPQGKEGRHVTEGFSICQRCGGKLFPAYRGEGPI